MKSDDRARGIVARAFTFIEDVVYVGLGAMLALSAIMLLGGGAIAFVRQILAGTLAPAVIVLLDRLLLTLMVIELLYTVRCRSGSTRWFRSRSSLSALSPRPVAFSLLRRSSEALNIRIRWCFARR